jgi:hypothetical protein
MTSIGVAKINGGMIMMFIYQRDKHIWKFLFCTHAFYYKFIFTGSACALNLFGKKTAYTQPFEISHSQNKPEMQ